VVKVRGVWLKEKKHLTFREVKYRVGNRMLFLAVYSFGVSTANPEHLD